MPPYFLRPCMYTGCGGWLRTPIRSWVATNTFICISVEPARCDFFSITHNGSLYDHWSSKRSGWKTMMRCAQWNVPRKFAEMTFYICRTREHVIAIFVGSEALTLSNVWNGWPLIKSRKQLQGPIVGYVFFVSVEGMPIIMFHDKSLLFRPRAEMPLTADSDRNIIWQQKWTSTDLQQVPLSVPSWVPWNVAVGNYFGALTSETNLAEL